MERERGRERERPTSLLYRLYMMSIYVLGLFSEVNPSSGRSSTAQVHETTPADSKTLVAGKEKRGKRREEEEKGRMEEERS